MSRIKSSLQTFNNRLRQSMKGAKEKYYTNRVQVYKDDRHYSIKLTYEFVFMLNKVYSSCIPNIRLLIYCYYMF